MTTGHALQQSRGFARALSAYGATVLSDTPVILHRQFGPLGQLAFASRVDPSDVADSPVRLVNGETSDPAPYRAAGFRQILTPAHVAEWDLTVADLRAGLHQKWRNRLTKGAANGLRIRDLKWDGSGHDLFANADALARTRRFRAFPTALLSAFARINQGDALIFEAYDRGTQVAACLVLRHGDRATYQTAWSSAQGHALQAPRVLLFHAAQHLAGLGHRLFDLGVVDTENARGLARFKLGTGADVRALGGTWARLRGRG